jgi:hypothetical protein
MPSLDNVITFAYVLVSWVYIVAWAWTQPSLADHRT